MCGIAGFVNFIPCGRDQAVAHLTAMTGTLAHRGPDGEGTWVDATGRIALGHRRLSIIDLTNAGSQPMHSLNGNLSIVFNGEIYGFAELREYLEQKGKRFRGSSDTEVLISAVEAFGLEKALSKLPGMFAFALLDMKERRLYFARDRLGKKPLYIGLASGALVFASELKSLRAHPCFAKANINEAAISLYARYNYIPAPHSIYTNVIKLPPGSWLSVSIDKPPPSTADLLQSTKCFWDAYEVAGCGFEHQLDDEDEALDLIDAALVRAVKQRMISDVPVGAFLSGGVDSALVSAIMQEVAPTPVKTYTIRFEQDKYNEADHAAAVARYLNTDHMELTATPEMALRVVDRLPSIYDEPFSDPSQIPTVLVSELARRHVTVALSGDGGDEFFAGYKRYLQVLDFERFATHVPRTLFNVIGAMPIWFLEFALMVGHKALPYRYRAEASADRLKKLAEMFTVTGQDVYLQFVSQWKNPEEVVIYTGDLPCAMNTDRVPASLGSIERMMYRDMVAYLPDDILVKVDRASMAFGLEMRSPLLDHRVVELAWRMPASLRFSDRKGKVALRRLLARRLPVELFDRPKKGFGVPLNEWLRGPLSDWAKDMLSAERLRRDGFFNPVPIEQRLNEHLAGTRNWGGHLWSVLMFNAWLDRWQKI